MRAAVALLCFFALPVAAQERAPARRPAEERTVAREEGAPEAEEEHHTEVADTPADLEESLYLRERPDAIGRAARAHENAQLTRLLAQREHLATQRRDEAIHLLEEFVAEEPETASEMPDALLRLADLRFEVSRANYLAAFAAWQEVPPANRGAEPRPDYAPSLTLYDRILDRHRTFDRYDFVLYMKAFALVELDRAEDALAVYRRILAEFPRSRFVPDAHFALAEAAFSRDSGFEEALAEYEAVLYFPESELYDIALFKSAWCLWRMNRGADAARRFRAVLDLGQNMGNLSGDQRRRLRELQDEALNYLIQVFTEDENNTAADVFRFLQEIGGEQYASRVLARLSETYDDQARYDRAVQAYTLLLELDPASPDAPKYRKSIAEAYVAIGDVPHAMEAFRSLARDYGPRTTWGRQQADPEVAIRGRRLGERAVRRRALAFHEEGQRESQNARFEDAATLYRVYLESYGGFPAAYEIQFYLGEILFHRLERFSEAGDAYLAAVRKNPQGRYSRDALYNAIGAFERVREGELERCGTQAGHPANEACSAETPNDLKFGEAIALYVELYPNDPELPEILFRQGRLYYDRGIFDPAVRLFGQLLERFPSSQFAAPAGELILDSFNRAQDFANIESWARRLKSAPAFQSAEQQARLNGLILQAVFKIGEQLAARGDHEGAAVAYFRAAEEFPTDERARRAYYNAGLERQAAGQLGEAAEAYDRLIERHPGSPEGALGAWAAAQMYESIAQFSDAARYYEAYAERFPQGEKAVDALYNAVLLRLTAGDNDEAVRDGQRFVQAHATHQAVDEVTFFIGRAQENAEHWTEAAQLYQSYVRTTRNQDRKVEATTRLALVLDHAGDRAGAERALTEAVRLGRRNARRTAGAYYAAQARFLQGEAVLRQYEEIHIEGEATGLAQRLQQKSELLGRASTIFSDVVEFHVAEWVTAALYQIGHSYEQFAEALRGAPIPDGFNEEEEQSYRDQLAMFVIPMEERALEAFEGGYQTALELHIYNHWTQQLRDALTRLNDVQYPPFREMGGDIVSGIALPRPEPLDGLRRGDEAPAVQGLESPAVDTTTRAATLPADAPPVVETAVPTTEESPPPNETSRERRRRLRRERREQRGGQ